MAVKLDIFRTLDNIDHRNYDFYAELNDDEKKAFASFVIMRWMSGAPDQGGLHSFYLQTTNELVNKNLWDLKDHDELIWGLMASCGVGKRQQHKWIKGPSRGVKSKIDAVLKEYFQGVNETELRIIKKNMTPDQFRRMLIDYAMPEKEEKELVKQYKKETK